MKDPSYFHKEVEYGGRKVKIKLLVYVDDVLGFCDSEEFLKEEFGRLMSKYTGNIIKPEIDGKELVYTYLGVEYRMSNPKF